MITEQGILSRIRSLSAHITRTDRKLRALATDLAKVNNKTQRANVTLAEGLALGTTDITITWPQPWPDTAYMVLTEVISGAALIGQLTAQLKAASKTTTDCVITIHSPLLVINPIGIDVLGIRT